ncbi:MAG: hypothetical protein JOZ05_05530, partial [Acetobacteraceae bacterium]|nr:hypothetical protein [Acetobacteraceae bacterium]
LGLDDAFVRDCLDPVRAVEGRRTLGGTARQEVTRMIAEAQAALNAHEVQAAGLQARLNQSAALLSNRIRELAAEAA